MDNHEGRKFGCCGDRGGDVGVVLLGECSLSIMEFESLGLVCCWCEVVFSIWVKVFVVMVAEVGVEDLELVVRLVVRLV